jgi:hypothetical protein
LLPSGNNALGFEKYTVAPDGCDRGLGLKLFDEVAEDVANGRPEQGEDDNDNDGDEHEDQRVLNQTLAFFFGSE